MSFLLQYKLLELPIMSYLSHAWHIADAQQTLMLNVLVIHKL